MKEVIVAKSAGKSSAVTLAENHIEDLIRLDNTCIWTDNTQ